MTTQQPLHPKSQTRTHYPTHFDTFSKCPRRYLLKVIERRHVPAATSVALEKGRVFHDVIKHCIDHLVSVPPSCPARLHDEVAWRLPRRLYASDEAWQADVDEIVGWVKTALTYLAEAR